MKTAEQILDEKNLHWTYYPQGDSTKDLLHDCDCRFCEVETPVIEAMEEYAEQFRPRKTTNSMPCEDSYVLAWDEYGIMNKVWFDDALPNSFKNKYEYWMPLPETT
jgi:hypothetical protein